MAEPTRGITLSIDSSKAEKALKRLRDAQIKVAKAVNEGKVATDVGAKSLGRLIKREKDLIKVNKVLDKSFGQAEKAVKDETKELTNQERAAKSLNDELERLDQQKSRTAQQVGLAGDVGSQGRTLGGAVGAFGGETGAKIEAAVSALAEIPDSLEALPLLKDSLKGIPAIATKVADGLGTTKLALGGLAVGTIALGVALAIGKKRAQESREALQGLLEAEKLRAEITNEGRKLTDEELDLKISEIAAQRELVQAENERNQALVNGLDAAPLWIRGIGELSSAIGVGSQAFGVAEDAAEQSASALKTLEREEALLIEVRDNSGNEAAELAAQEAELTEKRKESVASTAQALTAFEQADDRLNNALASRAQSQADAAEFAALEATFAAQDQENQETEHRANLDAIASEGRAGIEELQAGFGKLAQERAKALEGIDTKGNTKLDKIRGDFFGKQIAKTQDFQRETEQIESDTAKKRAKLLADLNDSLSDAARDNNVIAFLEAQRDGNKKLAEDAVDAQDAESRRVEEFARNRERERAVFLEKEAETLAAIETEKAAVIASFAEKQVALADQILAERTAIEERIQAEEHRFAQQELREQVTADRAAARAEIQARHEQRDFDARIAALQAEQQLRQQLHQEELSALQALQSQIAQLASAASRPAGGSTETRRTNGRQGASRFGQRRPNSRSNIFHEGGTIDFGGGRTEGFAFVEKGEQILSNRDLATQSSQGLPLSLANRGGSAGGRGAINVTVQDNRTVQVGAIASPSEVSQALKESNTALMVTLNEAFEGMTA